MKNVIIIIAVIFVYGFQIACQSKKKVEPITLKLDTAIWYTDVSGLHDTDPRAMHFGSVNVIVKGTSNAKKVYFRQIGMGLLAYEKLKLDSTGRFYDTLFFSSTLNLKKDSFQCNGTLFATNDTIQSESDLHFSPFLEDDKKNTIQFNFKSPYLKYNY
jgi:hypothetical protein